MLDPTLESELIAYRRDFHAHPELGFEEHRTAARLKDILEGLGGLEVQTGVAGTGLVVLLRGARPGKTLLIRADMDALPITEIGQAPYRSTRPGVMHACGHDAHMAMLLGVIRVLIPQRDRLAGTLKFVFQPAEEGPGGAWPMIQAGVMENPRVDAALGCHVWNSLPVGTIGVVEGPCMANTDVFEIHVEGRGGHGAMPHQTTDAVVVAAHLVTAMQSIVSRQVDPLESAVLTVGTIRAGDRHNVIAHSAHLSGTARSFSPHIAELLPARLEGLVEHVAAAFGARARLDYRRVYPATVNDPSMCALVRTAAGRLLGADRVLDPPPSMGGEDMSHFLEQVPGCYFFVGAAAPGASAPPHHHPGFDIDEGAIAVGVRVMAEAALDYLKA